jgi:hypothetical protein
MLVLLKGGKYELRVEMGLDAMICIPRSIKIGSGIKKLIGGYTQIGR